MVQSTWPSVPASTGEPVRDEGRHSTSANLSTPLLAIVFDTHAWSLASRFTQNDPVSRISGHAREVRDGTNSTSGGSSETLAFDALVLATGSSPRRLDVPGADGARETWTTLGRGTLAIGPLVAGQPTTLTLDAVAMHRNASGTKPALDGLLSGTLHATIAPPVRILKGGGCPARVPGMP